MHIAVPPNLQRRTRPALRRAGALFALSAALALPPAAVPALAHVGAIPCVPAAQPAPEPDASAAALVAAMPRSAELIIVFDNASTLRQSALWAALRPSAPDMAASWAQLASTLGWTPDEAFDRILGRRVALVLRGLPDEGFFLPDPAADAAAPQWKDGLRWALISEVSPDTERRLLERLAAAPRNIVRGCQLLAVERGRYELAIHRPRRRAGAAAQASSTLIFGEAGRAELRDEVVAVLTDGPQAPMRGTPAHAALARLGPADAAVMYRRPGAAWEDWAALAIRRDGQGRAGVGGGGENGGWGGWSARLSVSESSIRDALLRVPLTTDAPAAALADGALAAIIETRLPADADDAGIRTFDANPAGALLDLLGVPAIVHDHLGSRQALVLRRPDTGRGLALALALELTDFPAVAPAADRFMAALAAAIEGPTASETEPPIPDFAGVAPAAVRIVPSRNVPAAFEEFLPPGDLSGHTAALAWTFRPSTDPHTPVSTPPHRAGWWILAAAVAAPPSDAAPDAAPNADATPGAAAAAAVVTRLSRDLAPPAPPAPPPGDHATAPRRWLSRGTFRPADIAAATGAGSASPVHPLAPWLRMLSQVHTLSWDLSITDTGAIEGAVHIHLAE